MKLVVEFSILHLLSEAVVFAVVANAVHLGIVALNVGFVLGNLAVALADFLLQLCNIGGYLLDTSGHALDFVLKVLHFEGQFATQCLDAIDFGKHALQGIKVLKLLLNAIISGVFL